MAREVKVSILLQAKNLASRAFNELRSTAHRVKSAVFSVQGAIASLGVTLTAGVIVGFLVKVNREYGKLLTQLQTFEGSSEGARAVFRDLAKFASQTPFQIGELTEAYITLRSAGITPTMESLRLFGDHAAAFGQPINEFAMAIRSLSTGETERMKQFGVVARLEGDKLSLTFRGVTTTIGRSTQEITKYLEELSRQNFAGGMERQSKTLDGAISNMVDAFESFARRLGDAGLTDWLVDATRKLTSFTDALGTNDSALRKWVDYTRDTFGVIGRSFEVLGAVIEIAALKWEKFKLMMPGIGKAPTAAIREVERQLAEARARRDAASDRRTDAINERGARFRTTAGMQNDPLVEKREIAAARAAASSGLGIKETGASSAPGTVFDATGGAKKNEQARKEGIDDLREQAELLAEQIDLRVKGTEALKEALALEQRLTLLMGKKDTTPGEQLALLKTRTNLRQTRRERGITAPDEPNDASIDQLLEQAALLREQIELRVAGNDALKKAIALETKMALMMGISTTTAAEQLALLKGAGSLRATRREQKLLTGTEQNEADLMAAVQRGMQRGPSDLTASLKKSASTVDVSTRLSSGIGNAIKDAIGETQTLNQIIADMSTNTLRGFGSAIESAFSAMADGSLTAGQAFSAAMLGALGEVASGLGQLALGKMAIAIGDGLLGYPGGFAAAGKYLAAATALFAVGGLLKGKAGTIGGGSASSGRGDANRSNRDLNGSAGEGTLIIEGDPVLDMSNPRTERRMKRALESFGKRKVKIKKNY